MANLARLTGWHMSHRLTGCADTVVTTFAIAADTGVREIVHSPAVGGMTEIASLIGNNMIGRFTGCTGTVMTGFTTAGGHRRVIEEDQ